MRLIGALTFSVQFKMNRPSSQQTQVAKVGFFTKFRVPLTVVGVMMSISTYLFMYVPYSRQVRRKRNGEVAEAIYQAQQKENTKTNFQQCLLDYAAEKLEKMCIVNKNTRNNISCYLFIFLHFFCTASLKCPTVEVCQSFHRISKFRIHFLKQKSR